MFNLLFSIFFLIKRGSLLPVWIIHSLDVFLYDLLLIISSTTEKEINDLEGLEIRIIIKDSKPPTVPSATLSINLTLNQKRFKLY